MKPRIRPGTNTYSEAVAAGTRSIILSTSITRDISEPDFNKHCITGYSTIRRLHGGKVRHIKNQIATYLAEERPENAVLVIGGNDLMSHQSERKTGA